MFSGSMLIDNGKLLLSLHNGFGEFNSKAYLHRDDTQTEEHTHALEQVSNLASPTDFRIAKVNTDYSLLYLAD